MNLDIKHTNFSPTDHLGCCVSSNISLLSGFYIKHFIFILFYTFNCITFECYLKFLVSCPNKGAAQKEALISLKFETSILSDKIE